MPRRQQDRNQIPKLITKQTQKTDIATLPADIQDYIKRLRTENEEANKKAKREADEKSKAEEKRLAEQGEFKALAEKHETRVKELEPVQERYSKLAELTSQRIQSEIKDWPAEAKALLPAGENIDPLALMDAVDKVRPIVEKLKPQNQQARQGSTQSPPPAGNQNQRPKLNYSNLA
jgi:predicted nuclease with TOPRIM domain